MVAAHSPFHIVDSGLPVQGLVVALREILGVIRWVDRDMLTEGEADRLASKEAAEGIVHAADRGMIRCSTQAASKRKKKPPARLPGTAAARGGRPAERSAGHEQSVRPGTTERSARAVGERSARHEKWIIRSSGTGPGRLSGRRFLV
jgi:hypothetical protein